MAAIASSIAALLILFPLGWFFLRPGGWLSDEESPKRGRRDG